MNDPSSSASPPAEANSPLALSLEIEALLDTPVFPVGNEDADEKPAPKQPTEVFTTEVSQVRDIFRLDPSHRHTHYANTSVANGEIPFDPEAHLLIRFVPAQYNLPAFRHVQVWEIVCANKNLQLVEYIRPLPEGIRYEDYELPEEAASPASSSAASSSAISTSSVQKASCEDFQVTLFAYDTAEQRFIPSLYNADVVVTTRPREPSSLFSSIPLIANMKPRILEAAQAMLFRVWLPFLEEKVKAQSAQLKLATEKFEALVRLDDFFRVGGELVKLQLIVAEFEQFISKNVEGSIWSLPATICCRAINILANLKVQQLEANSPDFTLLRCYLVLIASFFKQHFPAQGGLYDEILQTPLQVGELTQLLELQIFYLVHKSLDLRGVDDEVAEAAKELADISFEEDAKIEEMPQAYQRVLCFLLLDIEFFSLGSLPEQADAAMVYSVLMALHSPENSQAICEIFTQESVYDGYADFFFPLQKLLEGIRNRAKVSRSNSSTESIMTQGSVSESDAPKLTDLLNTTVALLEYVSNMASWSSQLASWSMSMQELLLGLGELLIFRFSEEIKGEHAEYGRKSEYKRFFERTRDFRVAPHQPLFERDIYDSMSRVCVILRLLSENPTVISEKFYQLLLKFTNMPRALPVVRGGINFSLESMLSLPIIQDHSEQMRSIKRICDRFQGGNGPPQTREMFKEWEFLMINSTISHGMHYAIYRIRNAWRHETSAYEYFQAMQILNPNKLQSRTLSPQLPYIMHVFFRNPRLVLANLYFGESNSQRRKLQQAMLKKLLSLGLKEMPIDSLLSEITRWTKGWAKAEQRVLLGSILVFWHEHSGFVDPKKCGEYFTHFSEYSDGIFNVIFLPYYREQVQSFLEVFDSYGLYEFLKWCSTLWNRNQFKIEHIQNFVDRVNKQLEVFEKSNANKDSWISDVMSPASGSDGDMRTFRIQMGRFFAYLYRHLQDKPRKVIEKGEGDRKEVVGYVELTQGIWDEAVAQCQSDRNKIFYSQGEVMQTALRWLKEHLRKLLITFPGDRAMETMAHAYFEFVDVLHESIKKFFYDKISDATSWYEVTLSDNEFQRLLLAHENSWMVREAGGNTIASVVAMFGPSAHMQILTRILPPGALAIVNAEGCYLWHLIYANKGQKGKKVKLAYVIDALRTINTLDALCKSWGVAKLEDMLIMEDNKGLSVLHHLIDAYCKKPAKLKKNLEIIFNQYHPDCSRSTVLHFAIRRNVSLDVLEFLISQINNIDLSVTDNDDRRTALHLFVENKKDLIGISSKNPALEEVLRNQYDRVLRMMIEKSLSSYDCTFQGRYFSDISNYRLQRSSLPKRNSTSFSRRMTDFGEGPEGASTSAEVISHIDQNILHALMQSRVSSEIIALVLNLVLNKDDIKIALAQKDRVDCTPLHYLFGCYNEVHQLTLASQVTNSPLASRIKKQENTPENRLAKKAELLKWVKSVYCLFKPYFTRENLTVLNQKGETCLKLSCTEILANEDSDFWGIILKDFSEIEGLDIAYLVLTGYLESRLRSALSIERTNLFNFLSLAATLDEVHYAIAGYPKWFQSQHFGSKPSLSLQTLRASPYYQNFLILRDQVIEAAKRQWPQVVKERLHDNLPDVAIKHRRITAPEFLGDTEEERAQNSFRELVQEMVFKFSLGVTKYLQQSGSTRASIQEADCQVFLQVLMGLEELVARGCREGRELVYRWIEQKESEGLYFPRARGKNEENYYEKIEVKKALDQTGNAREPAKPLPEETVQFVLSLADEILNTVWFGLVQSYEGPREKRVYYGYYNRERADRVLEAFCNYVANLNEVLFCRNDALGLAPLFNRDDFLKRICGEASSLFVKLDRLKRGSNSAQSYFSVDTDISALSFEGEQADYDEDTLKALFSWDIGLGDLSWLPIQVLDREGATLTIAEFTQSLSVESIAILYLLHFPDGHWGCLLVEKEQPESEEVSQREEEADLSSEAEPFVSSNYKLTFFDPQGAEIALEDSIFQESPLEAHLRELRMHNSGPLVVAWVFSKLRVEINLYQRSVPEIREVLDQKVRALSLTRGRLLRDRGREELTHDPRVFGAETSGVGVSLPVRAYRWINNDQ